MRRSARTMGTMAVLGLLAGTAAQGGELVHSFVNPDFGGNPLNGNYLLSNATAQNNHKPHPTTTAPSSTTSKKTTTAQRFQEMVDNLVISSLANRIVNKAFGTSTLPAMSSVDTGLNTISVQSTASGTTVTIVDNKTGGRSVINIPNY
jgi:curli production assembly/transport component CsgF